MIAATISPAIPATNRALMLLSMFAVTQSASVPSALIGSGWGFTDQHTPASEVGTTATMGASIPATFRHESSHVLLALMMIRHSPIAISPPTKMDRTGV